jgi:signal transduction histidine kinase
VQNQHRLVLMIVAAASLPLIALVIFGIAQGKVLAEARVAEERVALAQAAALATSAFVDGNLSTARSLGRIPAITAASGSPELEATFRAIQAENPDWDGWGLAAPDGWNTVTTGAPPGTLSVGDRPYFQAALRTNRPIVSPAVLNRRTGQPTVALAVPIEIEGLGRGAIIVSLSTARLATELQGLRQDPSIRVALVDAEGTLIAHPNADLVADQPSMRGRPSFDAALRGEVGSLVTNDDDGVEAIVAYAPVERLGWGIVVSQPTVSAFDVVRRQTALGIVILCLAVLLAGIIGWYLGKRLTDLYRRQREATLRAEASAVDLARVSAESDRRRRFLEGVIESAPVAIAILRGSEYRHETLNARYEALRPGVEMLDRTIDEVFSPSTATAMRETFDRVAETGEQAVLVDRPLQVDGSGGAGSQLRYFTQVVAPLADESGQPDAILSIVLETTDVVLARQRAEREKDELLSTASHELKTPLTSLALAAQMIDRMHERGPRDDARLERYLGTIRAQIARLTRLIGSLLDVSRVETGRLVLAWEPVDLSLLARMAVARERDSLPEESGHRIVLRLDAPVLMVDGDEARLEQVLANLLSNAVKYSPAGGLVEVVVWSETGGAIVEVIDRGIGVPLAERPQLFAPFSRTTTALGTGIEGTGLGLYISRRIVEAHGGTIDVRDTPGGGATFRVALPVRRTAATVDGC